MFIPSLMQKFNLIDFLYDSPAYIMSPSPNFSKRAFYKIMYNSKF